MILLAILNVNDHGLAVRPRGSGLAPRASTAARGEIEATVRGTEKIGTAPEPDFQRHFVDAMALPHATAPSPHLSRVVELPQKREAADGAPDGRRRRRRK